MKAANFILNEWESDFFGRKIYTLSSPLNSIVETHIQHTALLSVKITSNDYRSIDFASKSGFKFVEGEVTYSKKLGEYKLGDDSIPFTLADESVLDDLNKFLTGLYLNSRFRAPWFSEDERDSFYRCWLRNAILAKFDDCCLVIKEKKEIYGFITLRVRQEKASIGLIGVAPDYHGKGIGKKLIKLAESYCSARSVMYMTVSTQMSNLTAANLYIKTGFSATEASHWFYKQV